MAGYDNVGWDAMLHQALQEGYDAANEAFDGEIPQEVTDRMISNYDELNSDSENIE